MKTPEEFAVEMVTCQDEADRFPGPLMIARVLGVATFDGGEGTAIHLREKIATLIAARDAEHDAALRSAMDRCERAERDIRSAWMRANVVTGKGERSAEGCVADLTALYQFWWENSESQARRAEAALAVAREEIERLKVFARMPSAAREIIDWPCGCSFVVHHCCACSKEAEGRASRVPESSVCTVAAVDRPSSGLVPASPALSAPPPADSPAIRGSTPEPGPAPPEPTCATCLGTGEVLPAGHQSTPPDDRREEPEPCPACSEKPAESTRGEGGGGVRDKIDMLGFVAFAIVYYAMGLLVFAGFVVTLLVVAELILGLFK